MTSQTLIQAVDLLRRRLDEVNAEIAALTSEASEVQAALDSLGGIGGKPDAAFTTPTGVAVMEVKQGGGRRGTVRDAVERVFASTPNVVSLDELVDQLKEAHQSGRTDDQFRSTIRTALWTLRRDKVIVPWGGKGKNIGVKWLPENASGPDESGPEDAVTSSGRGGDSHPELDQDHGDNLDGRHRDDRGGAPVGEGPLVQSF